MKIRHQLAKNAQKLFLNFGESHHIFAGIGENFPLLDELSITQQTIKFIEKENFIDLFLLEKLDLTGNEIELLPQNVFEDLRNLKILKISNNRIRKISEQMFFNLKQLRVLMLQNNKISHLPENLLEKNTQMIELYVWGNSFDNKNVVFPKLSNMNFHRDSGDEYFKGSMKLSSKIIYV